jgi:hypothetical protein
VVDAGFVVLLRRDGHLDPRVYGDVVASLAGLTKLEARLAVRRGRGILLERLPEAAARAIVDRLMRDGIETRAFPATELPVLPAPRRAVHAENDGDLLRLRAPDGSEDFVPFDALRLVHFAPVIVAGHRHFFTAGTFEQLPSLVRLEGDERDLIRENLILRMESRPPDLRLKRERSAESVFHDADARFRGKLRFLGDLVTADLGTRHRVSQEEFSWGSGPDRLGGPAAMHRLARELRTRRPEAFPEAALRLLDAADIRDHVVPDIEEHARFTTWCIWKEAAWPNADSSSPSPGPPASSTDAGSSSASSGPGPAST